MITLMIIIASILYGAIMGVGFDIIHIMPQYKKLVGYLTGMISLVYISVIIMFLID